MELAVVALTFAAIFVVELPDKTFIAALVLSTRYKPVLVWIGVGRTQGDLLAPVTAYAAWAAAEGRPAARASPSTRAGTSTAELAWIVPHPPS